MAISTILRKQHYFLGYSCALVSDILLQGHLYLTENYFAFYSNVFGYVTKVRNVVVLSYTKLHNEMNKYFIQIKIGLIVCVMATHDNNKNL